MLVRLITYRTCRCIRIVKNDSDRCFGNTGLTLLVDQFLKIAHAHLTEIRNAQNKADGVKDITLASSVEACDSIELRIEAGDNRPLGIRFEPIDYYLVDIHYILLLLAASAIDLCDQRVTRID